MVLVEIHVTGQLQLALKRPLIGWDYHATHTPYSRGISILIAKTVQFGIISVHVDPQGRFVFLHGTIYGKPYLILACYIPLPYNSAVINAGFLYMAQYPTTPAIWLGDFTMVLNLTMDRLHTLPLPPATHQHSIKPLTRGFFINRHAAL